MRAAVFGSVAWNLMIRVEKLLDGKPGTVAAASYHETVGGGGAGKALNLARLGLEVTLHAGLDDEAGEKVRERLRREPLHMETTEDPRGTARHVNLMDPHGGQISYLIGNGSDDNGLGDALFSGTLFGVLSGDTLGEALRYGARASAMSLGSPELASDDLSAETVRAGPG